MEAIFLAQANLPPFIEEIWEWIKLDWTWILRAVVEIAALAVGIYYMFTFLQRSRGWPVVVGFLVLIGLTTMIAMLKLQVLRWLLQQLFLFTTVAILIIFQLLPLQLRPPFLLPGFDILFFLLFHLHRRRLPLPPS